MLQNQASNGTNECELNQQKRKIFNFPETLKTLGTIDKLPDFRFRWNSNEEVFTILTSLEEHKKWLSNDVKLRPPNGSLLIYNRNNLKTRSYQNDKYFWKTRKNSKSSARVDHSSLRIRGIECIYCSYVHSALVPTFHRRCYWLLENPDIVLVHYLNIPDKKTTFEDLVTSLLPYKTLTKEELLGQLQPILTGGQDEKNNNGTMPVDINKLVSEVKNFKVPKTKGRENTKKTSCGAYKTATVARTETNAKVSHGLAKCTNCNRYYTTEGSAMSTASRTNVVVTINRQTSSKSRVKPPVLDCSTQVNFTAESTFSNGKSRASTNIAMQDADVERVCSLLPKDNSNHVISTTAPSVICSAQMFSCPDLVNAGLCSMSSNNYHNYPRNPSNPCVLHKDHVILDYDGMNLVQSNQTAPDFADALVNDTDLGLFENDLLSYLPEYMTGLNDDQGNLQNDSGAMSTDQSTSIVSFQVPKLKPYFDSLNNQVISSHCSPSSYIHYGNLNQPNASTYEIFPTLSNPTEMISTDCHTVNNCTPSLLHTRSTFDGSVVAGHQCASNSLTLKAHVRTFGSGKDAVADPVVKEAGMCVPQIPAAQISCMSQVGGLKASELWSSSAAKTQESTFQTHHGMPIMKTPILLGPGEAFLNPIIVPASQAQNGMSVMELPISQGRDEGFNNRTIVPACVSQTQNDMSMMESPVSQGSDEDCRSPTVVPVCLSQTQSRMPIMKTPILQESHGMSSMETPASQGSGVTFRNPAGDQRTLFEAGLCQPVISKVETSNTSNEAPTHLCLSPRSMHVVTEVSESTVHPGAAHFEDSEVEVTQVNVTQVDSTRPQVDGTAATNMATDNNPVPSTPWSEHIITEFSPEWSYCDGKTKVLILGEWGCQSGQYTCLFDGCSVPATLIQPGVLRCFCPPHEPGKVSLQVALRGFIISNACVFQYKTRESCTNSTSDWLGTSEEDLKRMILERIERLESLLGISVTSKASAGEVRAIEAEVNKVEDRILWICEVLLIQPGACRLIDGEITPKGLTLLHLAAGLGFTKLICFLKGYSCDEKTGLKSRDAAVGKWSPLAKDILGFTPLMWACWRGHQEASMMLLSWNPSSYSVCDQNGQTAHTIAESMGHVALVRQMKEFMCREDIYSSVMSGSRQSPSSSCAYLSVSSNEVPASSASGESSLEWESVEGVSEQSPDFEMASVISEDRPNTLGKVLVEVRTLIQEAEKRARSSLHTPSNSEPLAVCFAGFSDLPTDNGATDHLMTSEHDFRTRTPHCESLSVDSSPIRTPSMHSPGSPALRHSPQSTGTDTWEFEEFLSKPRQFLEKDFSELTLTDVEQQELLQAAKIIQNAYRQFKIRKKQHVDELKAAVLIQSYYRRYKQFALYKRITKAAVLIQNSYRAHKEHAQFKRSRHAAAVIQTYFRHYRKRKQRSAEEDAPGKRLETKYRKSSCENL